MRSLQAAVATDQLREYDFVRDHCDGEHGAGQDRLVCDGRREEATHGLDKLASALLD